MPLIVPTLSLALALVATLAAQDDVLYYKFDGAPGGDRVLNFAPSSSPAPREGRVVSNALAAAWSTGRFVHGFAGLSHLAPNYARVESGWAPNVSGEFSYACFLHFGFTNPTPSLTHIMGVPVAGGFRVYLNGGSLVTTGIDPQGTTYQTSANVWQMALSGWVHVLFVVDTNRSTASYYINGLPDVRLNLVNGARIVAPDFWVGQHLASQPGSVLDIDEVRVLTRAANPLEAMTWAAQGTAASTEFGAGCGGGRLVDTNGPPTLANGSYALVFGGQINAFGMLALGGSRHWMGAVPLPMDLGVLFASLRGCFWQSSSDLMFPVNLDLQGGGAFGLGIPNVPSLLNRPIFAQALFSDVISEASTNAFAISPGR